MSCLGSIRAVALRGIIIVAALGAALGVTLAEDGKYPDLAGQWVRAFVPRWAPGNEKIPLTSEYRKVFEANLADMATGGPGDVPSWYCLPQGMPMMMNAYDPMEVVVTPATTYILISHVNDSYRRIYTDGRDWSAEKDAPAVFAGYSLGKWIDEDGDGRYDVLEVETRHMRGPHTYDATGIPFHKDNEAVIKERIYLDKADHNTIYDEITVYDHAMTRPYSITKKAVRDPKSRPIWHTEMCSEDNSWVRIGKDAYYLSADGMLMPSKKGEAPPDLRYFKTKQ
jgi:hypothetical protein